MYQDALKNLQSIVEDFLLVSSSQTTSSNSHSQLEHFKRQFSSWKTFNTNADLQNSAISQPQTQSIESISMEKFRARESTTQSPIELSETEKKTLQANLVQLFTHIVKSTALNLPKKIVLTGENETMSNEDTVPASSITWNPFIFQSVKQGKSKILFTSPSIVRQVVEFEKHESIAMTETLTDATNAAFATEKEEITITKKTKKIPKPNHPLASEWSQILISSAENELKNDKLSSTPKYQILHTLFSTYNLKFSLSENRENNSIITGFIDVVYGSIQQPTSTPESQPQSIDNELMQASKRVKLANTTSSQSQSDQIVTFDSSSTSDMTSTSAEENSRHCLNPTDMLNMHDFKFSSLGYMDSCFKYKYGTPRQGSVVPSSRARLVLHAPISADSIVGFTEYSHVWLLFVFHSNTHKKYHPKISPPRLNGQRVGCLATRTPHRWNDIGLSLVKLERVEVPHGFPGIDIEKNNANKSRVPIHTLPIEKFQVTNPSMKNANATPLPGCAALIFSGVDLVDGTPIVDIKPYHPSDCVMPQDLTIPDWQRELPMAAIGVEWSQRATKDMDMIFEQYSTCDKKNQSIISPLQFYDTKEQICQAITETLSMDPRPLCTKTRHQEGIYGFAFDNLNIIYRMSQPKVAQVCFIEYIKKDTSSKGKELKDDAFPKMEVLENEIEDESNVCDGQVVRNRKREIMNQKDWLEQMKLKLHDAAIELGNVDVSTATELSAE